MSYLLRTDTGVLIAEVTESIAFQMMDNISGYMESKNFVHLGKTTCYVFDTKGYMTIDGSVTLCILKGYYLIKR